jgi:electron transfer flavoprotein alpha subunit
MAKKLVIHQNLKSKENNEAVLKVCPFGGLIEKDGTLDFTAGCKHCGLCAKKGPKGYITEEIEQEVLIDKSLWSGISVFVECDFDQIHPVSFELIGKALELSKISHEKVSAVVLSTEENKEKFTKEILEYGVDEVIYYSNECLKEYQEEYFGACLSHYINHHHPSSILYGGTCIGRSLAPKMASLFHTGLTADCTKLDMKENSDLVQIRPAFGGNVMAQIICSNHRPQMATVRYKIFAMPKKVTPTGKVIYYHIDFSKLATKIKVLCTTPKPKIEDISKADIIVACGRGFKKREDLKLAEDLAKMLGGVVAGTRPLIELGWLDASRQIGLSGRSVSPKLLICLGISGAVQFAAGISNAELVISVNKDPNAPIFSYSHYAFVEDIMDFIPKLLKQITNKKEED